MWQSFNPNPKNSRVGDCTVRALSRALDSEWDETYVGLCVKGLELSDMPSANHVWGAYLRDKDFERKYVPNTCPDCYTVMDFCEEHPRGKFVVALNNHVVAVVDGEYYDTWDSGNEVVLYYWEKEEREEQ